MNLIQSSPSLTKHNITIVTLLSGPMAPENNKKFFKKKIQEKNKVQNLQIKIQNQIQIQIQRILNLIKIRKILPHIITT